MDSLTRFVDRIRSNTGFTTSVLEFNTVVRVTYRGHSGCKALVRRISITQIESCLLSPEDFADFEAESMRDQI